MARTPVSFDALLSLALDRLGSTPFTNDQAVMSGVSRRQLGLLVDRGVVRRLVKRVYVVAAVADSLALRCAALSLVVPQGAVVTDRTAAWLHGATMALAPGDHLTVPPVSAFHRTEGCRLRNDLTSSGERTMPDTDVREVDGLLVTSPLRTALDLGRLLPREQAFAAMEQLLGLQEFTKDDLLDGVDRFKGYRGVVQLRALAPLTDHRSQSPPESVLRLRWIDCSDLPRPEPQVAVPGPFGSSYWLDMGVETLRLGAEYDGVEWHGPERSEHDAGRRSWVEDTQGWVLPVFTHVDLWPRPGRVERRLRAAFSVRLRRVTVL